MAEHKGKCYNKNSGKILDAKVPEKDWPLCCGVSNAGEFWKTVLTRGV